MRISMSGLDYTNAPIDVREKIGLDDSVCAVAVAEIAAQPDVSGCVIISTCNRTEIYISSHGTLELSPEELLRGALGAESVAGEFVTRYDGQAIRYLAELACGLHSLIWGEDQILSQIKRAITISRKAGCSDAVLETMFRACISAGKEVKSSVRLVGVERSAAHSAVRRLRELLGSIEGKSVLVIGNGEMGRLSAKLLREAGCDVRMTLRAYRHGQAPLPEGCRAVAYNDRYIALKNTDILISATTSPHYTITAEGLGEAGILPAYIVDLAVPRDIEPSLADCPGVTLLNIDSLNNASRRDIPRKVHEIIEKHVQRFNQWQDYRNYLNGSPRFPLFVDISGRQAVVIGGGPVAIRRIKTLISFGADVLLIAPTAVEQPAGVQWLARRYQEGDLDGAFLVVAATNDRDVNREIGRRAREMDIPVSVSDCRDECTFFFPAICTGDGVVAGVVGDGSDHKKTVRATKALRRALEEFDG